MGTTNPLPPEFLIDKILPTEEVHILGGPSGAGKTRWLFQMLLTWTRGEPVLGYESFPTPYVYVSTDRSQRSVHRTLKDLGIDRSQIPIIAAVEREPKGEQGYSATWLLDLVEKEHPKAHFIVTEGLATFVPSGKTNDYAAVSKFLRALTRECQKRHKTFLGVHHTTKAKGEDAYDNPREKLLGSGAWAAYAETILILDFLKSSDIENPYRRLHILPRNHAPNQVRTYKVSKDEGGRLIELAKNELPATATSRRQKEDVTERAFEEYFRALEAMGSKSFETKDLEKHLESSMSRATIYNKLKELTDRGTLKKSAHGTYEIARESLADMLLGD